jgi:hypothetical protein
MKWRLLFTTALATAMVCVVMWLAQQWVHQWPMP